ncbi:hypothetical protein SAMN04489737_1139 [Arcanobacterium phocae]|uniref:Uncharacterized protein n=1 Tax=Arcanobacterium phocae TaxID=131112 RepID=A0A1H2LH39_9ACTO|nr:hypothetical protein SAMN04489737_1139 [Arcanobacterium phocae]
MKIVSGFCSRSKHELSSPLSHPHTPPKSEEPLSYGYKGCLTKGVSNFQITSAALADSADFAVRDFVRFG